MSLSLRLNFLQGRLKAPVSVLRISFRGRSESIEVRGDGDGAHVILVDRDLEWSLSSELTDTDQLLFQLFPAGRFGAKAYANLRVYLQGLLETGFLHLSEPFADHNHAPVPVRADFLLSYQSRGGWELGGPGDSAEDTVGLLAGAEGALARLSSRPSSASSAPSPRLSAGTVQPRNSTRTRTSRIMSLWSRSNKRQKAGSESSEVSGEEGAGRLEEDWAEVDETDAETVAASCTVPAPTLDGGGSASSASFGAAKLRGAYSPTPAVQDFQVAVSLIEAKLSATNISPIVCVQVGDQKRFSSDKQSTHCPSFNEYFVFDFRMPAASFMDQLILLTVYHHTRIFRPSEVFGSFKLDVATVYGQRERQFHHKWAVLMDPQDMSAGARGYLKVSIAVSGKGETVRAAPKPEKDDEEDNIEANLLLPAGVSTSRQQARYIFRVYQADGLPSSLSSVMARAKKALGGSESAAYSVSLSFAGHKASTGRVEGSGRVAWNEELTFVEMFPPLVRRVRLQIRRSDPIGSLNLATHFLDLALISDQGRGGFLPTFGPAFIHFYGSDGGFMDKTAALNEGLGEGVSYRGRLLLSLRVEVIEGPPILVPGVSREPTLPIPENALGPKADFLLFGCIMDVTMLDKRLVDKQVHLEASLASVGLEGAESESPEPKAAWSGWDGPASLPLTPAVKAQLRDSNYAHLPLGDTKPCLFLAFNHLDLRWRLFQANALAALAQLIRLPAAPTSAVTADTPLAGHLMSDLVDQLIGQMSSFLFRMEAEIAKIGWNKLDRERLRICKREMERMVESGRGLKSPTMSLEAKVVQLRALEKELEALSLEPQESIPDLVLWLVCGRRRLGYLRVPARKLLFSADSKEKGPLCARLHSYHFKVPGSEAVRIQAQVTASFWLGLNSKRRGLLDGLPLGFKHSPEVIEIEHSNKPPPKCLEFTVRSDFDVRCYLYQARSLMASDDTGLSDPFVKMLFQGYSATSKVVEKTLNPTWDQTLEICSARVYGASAALKANPPPVILEVFDEDKMAAEEFMGQVVGYGRVQLVGDAYEPPALAWHPVHCGSELVGEVLAAFELCQLNPDGSLPAQVPPLPRLPPPEAPPPPMSSPKPLARFLNLPTPYSLLEDSSAPPAPPPPPIPVPASVRPVLAKYRMDVLFWGLRDLKRVNFLSVERPRIEVECGDALLVSDVIAAYSKNPNFPTLIKTAMLQLPEQPLYWPAVSVRCIDQRSFGRDVMVGSHVVRDLTSLIHQPIPASLSQDSSICRHNALGLRRTTNVGTTGVLIDLGPPDPDARSRKQSSSRDSRSLEVLPGPKAAQAAADDAPQLDWWSKYFASVEAMLRQEKESHSLERTADLTELSPSGASASQLTGKLAKGKEKVSHLKGKRRKKTQPDQAVTQLKIYSEELERQPEFEEFKDWIGSYELFRGRHRGEGDELERSVGRFKGMIRMARVDEGAAVQPLFTKVPSNDPVHVLVRVYVVKASSLHPTDLNGKADPYLFLSLGNTKINDKENYISKQLNPVFGKCFEVEALFPQESQLLVQVYDWDLVGRDDLIGETRIDLEDRYYSRHRATCGLSRSYDADGYNSWRDPLRPSQILAKMCKDQGLDGPHYEPGGVRVGGKKFSVAGPPTPGTSSASVAAAPSRQEAEKMALEALQRWEEVGGRAAAALVPEHVETRTLYHPERPGIARGKLELWLDMFPMDLLPRAPVDISPRKPKSFELRVIIWNTDDVVLEDDAFLTGEKMSDIYVKGWLKGPEDTQSTDIHYRSLTGEGNFNWRFVFPFEYLEAEEKIVVSRRESMFSWDETELKIPPRLELQVWDADSFSADDWLGSLSLNLTAFPRGAKSSEACSLALWESGDVPRLNLFKQSRVKGWWPFLAKDEAGEVSLTGKVEAEFHLVGGEEAEKNPCGFGRSEPNPLDKPSRPDSSFVWFLNPLKSMRYIMWRNYKWLIVKILVAVLVILFFALFLYSAPGYIVKRLIGA